MCVTMEPESSSQNAVHLIPVKQEQDCGLTVSATVKGENEINFEVVKVEPQQGVDFQKYSPADDHLTGPDTENNFTSVVFPVVKTEVQEDNEWETDAIKKELKEEVMKDGGEVLLEGVSGFSSGCVGDLSEDTEKSSVTQAFVACSR